jgi:hypothetical protein
MSESRSIDAFDPEAQAYIRELRAENAQYRVERNDYREKYTEVNTKYSEAGQLLKDANAKLDEFSAFKDVAESSSAELAATKEKFERLNVWAEALEIDVADAGRLQGSTPEEWKADAEKLAPRFKNNKPAGVPRNPAAGSSAGEVPEDPISKAFSELGL